MRHHQPLKKQPTRIDEAKAADADEAEAAAPRSEPEPKPSLPAEVPAEDRQQEAEPAAARPSPATQKNIAKSAHVDPSSEKITLDVFDYDPTDPDAVRELGMLMMAQKVVNRQVALASGGGQGPVPGGREGGRKSKCRSRCSGAGGGCFCPVRCRSARRR